MKGQDSFSAALGISDDTVLYTHIQFLLNSQGCKKLRMPHDVFFRVLMPFLICWLYIGKNILKREWMNKEVSIRLVGVCSSMLRAYASVPLIVTKLLSIRMVSSSLQRMPLANHLPAM